MILANLFPRLHWGMVVLPLVAHRLWCLISFDNTASAVNNNQNRVKLVALQTIVLWLHTALGMTSTHLPFFSPLSIFFTASKIQAIAHSIALLDGGWYTDVKETFVPT
jgi:membrane-bound acyltransferase YfiQ involved in biofilm formation